MAFPFLQIGLLAEDAVPFIAAVRVQDPVASSIYTDDITVAAPGVRDAGCALAPAGTDCARFILPFLSPPQVLPIMKVVDVFGDTGGVLLMRLLATGALAVGMWLLWRSVTPRRPEAAIPVLVAAVLLTPFVYTSSTFGQNAPLMFLSACLGLSQTDRVGRAGASAAVWVATVAFKVFPIPLILVAVIRRRWKFVAIAAALFAGLTVAAAPLAPDGAYGAFFSSSRALTSTSVASRWNVSIDAFIHLFDPGWRGEGALFYVVLLVRLAVIVGLCLWKLRDADEDFQWAYAWTALLFLHPQIWWHYFELIIPAVALGLRGRRGTSWYLLPAVALALLPMAVVTDEATLTFYGPVVITAAVLALPFLPTAASRAPSTAAVIATGSP
jgi:hypothetical protein